MSITKLLPRFLVLSTVLIALLGGLGSGLARLGWQMDDLSQDWLMLHGPLMISGFLGTLICMERAVALYSRYPWGMLVPLVNALGAIALLIIGDDALAKLILTLGSLGLVILFGVMIRIHPSRDVIIMAVGAICWLIGNGLWLMGDAIYEIVHLWVAFLILTIVGERLELSRVRRLSRQIETLLIISVGSYVAGVILTLIDLDAGIRLLGVGAIMMAGWLLRYDITRRTIQQDGLPRYIASCLLIGYVWLGFGGVMAVWKGAVYAGPDYGILLHAFLLGFVFSMIFGHMPIILPALTSIKFRYTPLLYGHLILLHTSLVYRMYGNLALDFTARRQAGLLNVIAVLLFIIVTLFTVIHTNIREKAITSP